MHDKSTKLPVWRFDKIVAYALVDASDLPILGQYRWRLAGKHRRVVRWEGKRAIYLARQLLGLEHGDPLQGDHINRDPLDNRRTNLRIITRAQQQQNQGPALKSRSGVRGVTWDVTRGKWQANAGVNGRQHKLGYFATVEEAAGVVTAFRRKHMPFSATDQMGQA